MAWFSTIIFLLLLISPPALPFSPAEASFSATLIHRDHPESPLYDPALTHYERQRLAIHRSFSRAEYFKSRLSNDIQSEIFPSDGEYLMELSIGTPPFKIIGTADTGSDLTWTQCSPCHNCHNKTAPLFKPSHSKTYRKLTCGGSRLCHVPEQTRCDHSTNHCLFENTYGDRSSASGDLAAETLTFRSTSGGNVSIPAVAIGCANKNTLKVSGIVGLGTGSLSIVRQMKKFVKGRFSYCLGNHFETGVPSKISFGPSATVSGPGTVSTPIFIKKDNPYYWVNLEGISLAHENSRISVAGNNSTVASNYTGGNIIIDSGTRLTLLYSDVYDDLAKAVKRKVDRPVVKDPEGRLHLCFQATDSGGQGFPDLVMHFSGADVAVSSSSAFVEVSAGVICFMFHPVVVFVPAVVGHLSLQNYNVGFDLEAQTVSFQPTNCSRTT